MSKGMALLLILVLGSTGYGQEKGVSKTNPDSQIEKQTPPSQALKPALVFGLEDGTPIKLRITRTISSADAKTDDKVDFEVLEDIKVKDIVVIPRGGIAWGTITEAMPKRRMGKAGKLSVNIDAVRLMTGEKAALRAVKDVQGGNHTGAMTGAIVASAIIFFPAAPFFLFMHGKDITIPKGTEITAYINGDAELDAAKFTSKSADSALSPVGNPQAETPQTKESVTLETSTVVVKSNPDSGEITVDGKFVGNTASTLRLTPGDRTISISKTGYKTWEKTITVTAGGNVTIEANLEKIP